MSYPSSLVVDIRSPVSDIQSPRLPIVKNIEQLPRKPRVYWTLMIILIMNMIVLIMIVIIIMIT